jgi:hypothetical protein
MVSENGAEVDEERPRATTVRELTTDAEWDAAVPLLRQLWSDADPAFVRSWREEDGYHLFGLYDGGEYAALANRLGNDDALRFYEDEGLERWGYVVEREL